MIPRKSKLSIDINRHVAEEEHEIKNGSEVKVEIKHKIEGARDMNDSNHQVQALEQQNYNMRHQIQELQQKN